MDKSEPAEPEAKKMKMGMEELGTLNLWRAGLSELFGLLLFTYISGGTVVAAALLGDASRLLSISFGHGLTIAVLVANFSGISGGHINPVVTSSFFLTGHISFVRAIVYIACQIVGGMAGAGLLWCTTPDEMNHYNVGVHTLNPKLSPGQGVATEIMLTALLVLTVYANAVDSKGHGTIAPLLIGTSVTVAHLVGVPLTGPSLNPARTFGAAVVSGVWEHHWIYWVGPFVGATMAALIYNYVFLLPHQREGSEGGGIDEVTPAVLLRELKKIRHSIKDSAAAKMHTDGMRKYAVIDSSV